MGGVATLKLAHVKLALAAGIVHVADLPEDSPLCPAVIMDATDGPEAACGQEDEASALPLAWRQPEGKWDVSEKHKHGLTPLPPRHDLGHQR